MTDFWKGKRVLVTGHTGFKGSWLSLWLAGKGAEVTGFALPPPTSPSLFEAASLSDVLNHVVGDVRDLTAVRKAVAEVQPEVVFHLAAQSLVRASYDSPVETYATNVMGTVHLLEAVRKCAATRSVVIVTSDKCYENREWVWGYREDDPMGGYDPYSNSKGCSELVTAAYRQSFFQGEGKPGIASVRAGNVIGGGDWARDRLIPDIIQAFSESRPVVIRNPKATRPWQHVLEPLSGYLLVAERLWSDPIAHSSGWNFGPNESDTRPVDWIVGQLETMWGAGASWKLDAQPNPHEAHLLKLDISKARALLGWRPRLELPVALSWTANWYRDFLSDPAGSRGITETQIADFERIEMGTGAAGQAPQLSRSRG